jgi:hypothetical protein
LNAGRLASPQSTGLAVFLLSRNRIAPPVFISVRRMRVRGNQTGLFTRDWLAADK